VTATLRLTCLGGLKLEHQVEQETRLLQKPPTLKSQSLLAYLICNRQQPQPRELLIGMFWGDRPMHKARRSLSTALWHIRRCFPDEDDPIQSDNQSVQFLSQADVWLDVDAFAANAARQEAQRLQAAVDLYHGDFLEGFYDDWVIDERYRLQGLLLDTLARLMDRYESAGQAPAALRTALSLIERDPLREDAHRLVMRVYVRQNRRNAALEQYVRCRDIVQAELGIEPAAETTELYHAIRAGRFTAEPRPAEVGVDSPLRPLLTVAGHNPLEVAAPNVWVGRDAELAFLRQQWQQAQSGRSQLVLLSGEAGVGKTRLVEAFAAYLRSQGAEVLWGRCYEFERRLPFQPIADALTVMLARMSATEFAHLPDWVNVALARLVPLVVEKLPRLAERSDAEIEQGHGQLFNGVTRFFAALAARHPLLLIVEDLHWASESTLELLHHLVRRLAGQPMLFVGTTRQEALGPGQALWSLQRQLQDEDLARPYHLERLSFEAVTALIAEMSGAGERVGSLAEWLYEETEGNPFFLVEIIKAFFETGILSLADGVWQGDFDRIRHSELALPATIRDAVEARVRRLKVETQAALRWASVLGREFDFDVLNAAWGSSAETALAALDDLLRYRLIAEGTATADRDYVFTHHKVQEAVYTDIPVRRRQFMHVRVAASLEGLHEARIDTFAGELAFHYEQGRRMEKAITYLRLAGEQAAAQFANAEAIDYFSRALTLTPEMDHAGRYGLMLARERIYDIQGARDAQAQDLSALEKLAQASSNERRAEVALRRANYAEVTGDYPAAITAAHLATPLAQASQSLSLEASCYLQLGRAFWRQGDYDAARHQFEQALALARTAQLPAVEADTLRNLGNVAVRQGQYARASNRFEQALRIFRETGDREGQALVLGHLGSVAINQSQYAEAIAYLEPALSIFRDIGYREGEANVLNSLGLLAANRGQYAKALAYYEGVLSIRREIGDRQGEGLALVNFGYVSWLRQDYATARDYLGQALPISREIGDRRVEGLALLNLGHVSMCLGEYTAATTYLDDGLMICREIGDRQKEGWGLSILGYVFDNLGAYPTAHNYFEQALHICRELGDRESEGWRLTDLGLVSLHSGAEVAARNYIWQALHIARDLDNRPIQAYALTALGHALTGLSQLAEASDAYREAIAVKEGLDQLQPAVEALAGLAHVSLERDDRSQAHEYVEEVLHYLERKTLAGIDELFRIYLICYRVLNASRDARARQVLSTAHSLLQARAAKIEDEELRRSFLENVPAHRDLVAAFAIAE
jgi:DNA-binding SARP family transcriptional activator/Tfp pilus assembly protein PilF